MDEVDSSLDVLAASNLPRKILQTDFMEIPTSTRCGRLATRNMSVSSTPAINRMSGIDSILTAADFWGFKAIAKESNS